MGGSTRLSIARNSHGVGSRQADAQTNVVPFQWIRAIRREDLPLCRGNWRSVKPNIASGHSDPNQVVTASRSPVSVPSPTRAMYPSGRISTAAAAAATRPRTRRSGLRPRWRHRQHWLCPREMSKPQSTRPPPFSVSSGSGRRSARRSGPCRKRPERATLKTGVEWVLSNFSSHSVRRGQIALCDFGRAAVWRPMGWPREITRRSQAAS
jgi:hypothetical protein